MNRSWRVDRRELDYVKRVLEGGFPGAQRESFTGRLEQLFAETFQSKYAISFANGTATLHAALHALGVGEGDEVIVPPLTMASTSLAVLHAGATPVFADVDPDTFILAPEDAGRKITSRTRAVMPVSLYGLPAAMPELLRYGLPVVEDSAQCFLGRIGERIAGGIGAAGSFSFQNSKHMTCGEGGMVITDDPALAERIRRFGSLGYGQIGAAPGKSKISKEAIASPETVRHTAYGFNYRLSELCSAVACAQLEKLEHFVAMRRRSAEALLDAASGCAWLRPQATPRDYFHSYWSCAMVLDIDRVGWQELRRAFVAEGGDGFYGAWRLTYREPWFAERFGGVFCPVAEHLQPRMVQFKTHYGSDAEIGLQALALKRAIGHFAN